jgi:hypothetical protein
MKTLIITSISLLTLSHMPLSAQEAAAPVVPQEVTSPEKYGTTLNLGAGAAYYGYLGQALPIVHADFEFDVARNFTLAPFITYYSYTRSQYWGNPKYDYKEYSYRQTVIPVGVKAAYYFDELLKANAKWDFYAAGSAGFAFRNTVWENGYYGETSVEHSASGLYLDAHAGAEYHCTRKLGMFLDLSTGISTIGLALHF